MKFKIVTLPHINKKDSMKKLGEASNQNSRGKQKVDKKRHCQQDPEEEEKEVPVKTRLEYEPINL